MIVHGVAQPGAEMTNFRDIVTFVHWVRVQDAERFSPSGTTFSNDADLREESVIAPRWWIRLGLRRAVTCSSPSRTPARDK